METQRQVSSFLAVSALTLALGGCAANQAIDNGARLLGMGGYDRYPGVLMDDAMQQDLQKVLNRGVASANQTVIEGGGSLRFDATLKEKLIPASSSPELEVEFGVVGERQESVFFAPGEYDLMRTKDAEAFSVFATHVMAFVKERLAGANVDIRIEADFYSGADGLRVQSGRLYGGEFGLKIKLSSQQLLLNGVPANFQVQAGDLLSNRSLAVLRAYALYHHFNSWAKKNGIANLIVKQRLVANESKRVSREMRFAKIKLTIKERKGRW